MSRVVLRDGNIVTNNSWFSFTWIRFFLLRHFSPPNPQNNKNPTQTLHCYFLQPCTHSIPSLRSTLFVFFSSFFRRSLSNQTPPSSDSVWTFINALGTFFSTMVNGAPAKRPQALQARDYRAQGGASIKGMGSLKRDEFKCGPAGG